MLLLIVLAVLTLLLFLYFLILYIEGNSDYWEKQGIQTVNVFKYFSRYQLYLFQTPFHEPEKKYYEDLKSKNVKYGGVVIFRMPLLLILDLDLVKTIIVKDFDHFVNRETVGLVNDKKFKQMLFSKQNQEWKDLRGTLSPTFSTSKIKRMFSIFDECSKKMTSFMERKMRENGDNEMDLRVVCSKFTMDVIASAVFGLESLTFESETAPFVLHGKRINDNVNFKMMLKFLFALVLPKMAKKFELNFLDPVSMSFLETVVKENIKQRKKTNEKRQDFLQLLIEAQEEAENGIENESNFEKIENYSHRDKIEHESNLDKIEQDDADKGDKKIKFKRVKFNEDTLIAQCILFFLAGFDNLETTLIYAAYELALEPQIQEKLYGILVDGLEKSGSVDNLSYDLINHCNYLDMVISETLRKYPPQFRLERKCNKDYKIPGENFTIPKDSNIVIPIYGIHHDPDYFPNPLKFDPERFNTENKKTRHPYAYLPFGAGPRMCIANRFSIIEGKVALANLVLNFKFMPCSKTTVPMKFTTRGVLKPINGMWLRIEKRSR